MMIIISCPKCGAIECDSKGQPSQKAAQVFELIAKQCKNIPPSLVRPILKRVDLSVECRKCGYVQKQFLKTQLIRYLNDKERESMV